MTAPNFPPGYRKTLVRAIVLFIVLVVFYAWWPIYSVPTGSRGV